MTLLQVLMHKEGWTKEQAKEEIRLGRELFDEYLEDGDQEAAYDICQELWGLEPDYIMDLMSIAYR